MRTRSPSRAPPVIGDDGSTATTATGRSASRRTPISAATNVDLPAPGGPVIPTRWAFPATWYSRRSAASARGVRFSTAVRTRASARRSPAIAASASSSAELAARGDAPTLVARSRVGAQIVRDGRDRGPRPEHRGDAGLLEGLDIFVRDDPADRDEDVAEARPLEQLGDPRNERHVRARQDRQPDHVNVLLERGRGDHL